MDAGDFDPSLAHQLEQAHAAYAERRLTIIAVLINSALYLTGTFVAGLVLRNHAATVCALASAGLCYLTPMWQLSAPKDRNSAIAMVALSIILGAAGGIALLIGG